MEYKVKKGDIYILKGPGKVGIKRGRIEAIGKSVKSGEEVLVPLGKSIPLEVKEESTLSIEIEKPGEIRRIRERTIPSSWDNLVKRIVREKARTILVLGEVDTGKSFFATYLANKLLEKGVKPAVLDGDPGQSDIGIPGTLGLAVLKKQVVFLTEASISAIYFVGSHSPGLHFLPTIVGIKRLVEAGLKKANTVIINTTGWVQSDGGRALKRAKIEILYPEIIVLLQRTDELEHLIKGYAPKKIVRINVSKKASFTSAEDRKKLREMPSTRYFKGARKIRLSLERIATDRCYFGTGKEMKIPGTLYAERLSGFEGTLVVTKKPLPQEKLNVLSKKLGNIRNIVAGDEKGILVGLLDEKGDTLGMGRIEEIDYKKKGVLLSTPVKDGGRIKIIQFGSLRITPEGREAGFVSPGYF
ncbi:hypothetical protein L6304_03980 [bacterium]|nr:hypothetical protein [bacterium]MCG2676329.1 hypothetical protein [bacterium]